MPLRNSIDTMPPFPPLSVIKSQGDGVPVRLFFNESPYGCSPLAQQVYTDSLQGVELYADGSQEPLISALAAHYNVPKGNLVAVPGTTEGLAILMRVLLNDGDDVVTSVNGYGPTHNHITAYGGNLIKVAERDYKIHIDGILNAVTENTKAVLLCNPNNPTGTYLPHSEIQRLHNNLPDHIYLILDSAYAEYANFADYNNGLSLFDPKGRVIVTQTFSKAYGMAALRIGWLAVPSDVAIGIGKIFIQWTTNTIALQTAAAALQDKEFLQSVIAKNTVIRDTVTKALRNLGLIVPNSATNFVMAYFPDTVKNSKGAFNCLAQYDLLVRPVNDATLRISLGTAHDMEQVVAYITDYLNA